jgi:hypothetical protein
VRCHGKTIDESEPDRHEALRFFAGQIRVTRRLKVFEQIGLASSGSTVGGHPLGRRQQVKLAPTSEEAGARVLCLGEPDRPHLGDVASSWPASTACWRGATCSSSSTAWM